MRPIVAPGCRGVAVAHAHARREAVGEDLYHERQKPSPDFTRVSQDFVVPRGAMS